LPRYAGRVNPPSENFIDSLTEAPAVDISQ